MQNLFKYCHISHDNVTEPNGVNMILDAVNEEILGSIISSYLNTLKTSSCIYDLNGNYALNILHSNWCRCLNQASKKMCGAKNNIDAMNSGKWLCHESCWGTASKASISLKQPVDVECCGGIRIYAVPILSNGEVIGSINFGYGSPPTEQQKLLIISNKFNINITTLTKIAQTYKPCSVSLIDSMKKQLQIYADYIGLMVEKVNIERQNNIISKIIDTSINGIFITDINGSFLCINDSFSKICDYSINELKSKTLLNIISESSCNKFTDEIIPIIINSGRWNGEELMIKKDGSQFLASINSTLIKNNGIPIAIISTFLDITEHKRIKDALNEREITLKNIYDSKLMGFLLWDADSEIIDGNDTFLLMLGYTRDSFFSKKIFWQDITPPEYTNLYNSVLSELSEKKDVLPFEQEFICKDGNKISVLIGTTVLPDPKLGGAAFVLDITERKLLEDQLKQAEKMEAIGHLSGGIAHDFNNILTIILANTEVGLKIITSENQVHSNLEQIRLACLRAKEVVQQLLFFARKTKSEKKPINIKSTVLDTLTLLKATTPATIKIVTNIENNLWGIYADSSQISQLLINLCTNSIQSMEEKGKGTIKLSFSNTTLSEFDCRFYGDLKAGKYIKIIISDTGHGIQEKDKKRIFEPYFTTRPVNEGTGLGLSVVHGIIKDLNGFISVESESSIGTTFKILFPATKERLNDTKKSIFIELPLTKKTRILLIDDEEAIVKSMTAMLTIMGFEVTGFTDPLEAFNKVKQCGERQFDLVITDLAMPGISGDILSQKIIEIHPNMPIILSTGYNDKIMENTVKDSKKRKKYIEKPFTEQELLKAINEIMR